MSPMRSEEFATHYIDWRAFVRGWSLKTLGRVANRPLMETRGDFDLLHFRWALRGIPLPAPRGPGQASWEALRRDPHPSLCRPRLSLAACRRAGAGSL